MRSGRASHSASQADFNFVQISDSHIGFNKPANTDVTATLQAALDKIAPTCAPDFLIHTGDLTHGSKPAEFDTLDQVLVGDAGSRCSTCPASTTRRSTTARCISIDTARTPKGTAGTASITRACTSSAW